MTSKTKVTRKQLKKDWNAAKPSKKKSCERTGEAVEYFKERATVQVKLREKELDQRRKELESVSETEKERNNQQGQQSSNTVKQQQQQQQLMTILN